MSGSQWQVANTKQIRKQCSNPDPRLGVQALPGDPCCVTCGCFYISWIAFPMDFCYNFYGDYSSAYIGGQLGLGTFKVACSPSDYPCVATPIKTFPTAGGACEGPVTPCVYTSTAYTSACNVCDFFRFHTGGTRGDAGGIPLTPTGGWVLFYAGPGFSFAEPIQVWINVQFQPLQKAPHCTGTYNVAGGPNPAFAAKPACCCDGTNYPGHPLTGATISPPVSCASASPPQPDYPMDSFFPTADTTIRCAVTDGTVAPTC